METGDDAGHAAEKPSGRDEPTAGQEMGERLELPRKPETTTLSHFILERIMSFHDLNLVQRLQQRLSEQDPKDTVHYLLRILPPALGEEFRAEQEQRGLREGLQYVGEVIQSASPPASREVFGPHSAPAMEERPCPMPFPKLGQPLLHRPPLMPPAEEHPMWQAMVQLCRQGRHGWEPMHGPVKLGPRRQARREELLKSIEWKPWTAAITEVAAALAISPQEVSNELHRYALREPVGSAFSYCEIWQVTRTSLLRNCTMTLSTEVLPT